MSKTRKQHASATAGVLFCLHDDYGCSSTFRASSWKDAITKVAKYVAEIDYNVDEGRMQRVNYNICRLAACRHAEHVKEGEA